ncbi:MAG: DUF3006 domain-containing protein [Armatimonadetes bacterium]|nr:DUF3006 domain-containing protein [Armatimonadota bacterium]
MGEAIRHRVWVDRIEGDHAVLLVGEGGRWQAIIPAAALPPGTGEGAALWLTLERDEEEERRIRTEVRTLMEDLERA